jgi:hypothetical protein
MNMAIGMGRRKRERERERKMILRLLLCRNNEIIVRGCVKFSSRENFIEEFDRFETERNNFFIAERF